MSCTGVTSIGSVDAPTTISLPFGPRRTTLKNPVACAYLAEVVADGRKRGRLWRQRVDHRQPRLRDHAPQMRVGLRRLPEQLELLWEHADLLVERGDDKAQRRERIVVEGVQKVRPGMAVHPTPFVAEPRKTGAN